MAPNSSARPVQTGMSPAWIFPTRSMKPAARVCTAGTIIPMIGWTTPITPCTTPASAVRNCSVVA